MAKNQVKTKKETGMTLKECIAAIEDGIATIRRLTGDSPASRELRFRWTELRCKLAAANRNPAGKAVAKAPVKASGKTAEKKAKTVKTARGEADAARPQPQKDPSLPSSVKISDREMELHLGSFGVKALADHDAAELIGHPMVFWYRRAMFPDPRQSRVR